MLERKDADIPADRCLLSYCSTGISELAEVSGLFVPLDLPFDDSRRSMTHQGDFPSPVCYPTLGIAGHTPRCRLLRMSGAGAFLVALAGRGGFLG